MQFGDKMPDGEKNNWWMLPVACIVCVLLVWALDWLL